MCDIIIGGGISGLYLLHKYKKLYPNNKIFLLEKYSKVGGRIDTRRFKFNDINLSYEAGAGRFSLDHKEFIELIDEFGLKENIKKINENSVFVSNDKRFIHPEKGILTEMTPEILPEILDFAFNNKTIIKEDERKEIEKDFTKYSLNEYLNLIFGEKLAKLCEDCFGYSGEFNYGNAKCMKETFIQEEYFSKDYYYLNGGLDILIKKLYELHKDNILLKTETKKILYNNKNYTILTNKGAFTCNKLFLTIPPKEAFKIYPELFNDYKNMYYSIKSISLNRIYTIFNKKDFELFYSNMKIKKFSKITTNLPIRMIIPYYPFKSSTGNEYYLVMFYNDTENADYFNSLTDKHKIKLVLQDNLNKLVEYSTGIKDITDYNIIEIMPEYWKDGVHIWLPSKIETDYTDYIKHLNKDNLYLINEAYTNVQGWINSSLKDVNLILS